MSFASQFLAAFRAEVVLEQFLDLPLAASILKRRDESVASLKRFAVSHGDTSIRF
jgi:hypothetical protein